MWITGIRVSYITLAQRKCIIFLSYYQPHHERDIHLIVYISISLYFEMTHVHLNSFLGRGTYGFDSIIYHCYYIIMVLIS